MNEPYSRTQADLPPGEAGVNVSPVAAQDENAPSERTVRDGYLLQKAYEIYSTSTSYLNSNVTPNWERSLAHFRNEHAPGSPVSRRDWKRSKTFRPKTRANIKAQEASLASAAFSTQDLLDVRAHDESNSEQTIGAQLTKAVTQLRLESSEMAWFLTCIGAYQDTKVYGICVSHQYWCYKKRVDVVPAFNEDGTPITEEDPDTGEQVAMGREDVKVLEDRPACDLVAPECFRFDPMCDWRRPAQTSPYIVYMMPIYAGDALDMMKQPYAKTGAQKWREYSLAEILSTRAQSSDNRTRQAREGNDRVDPAEQSGANAFTPVWAHLNIIRDGGEDIAYWTMGTQLVLTDPVPLKQMYPHLQNNERPFTVGFSTVEAHRNYPAGDVEQAAPLQEEINTVANQRLDNVKLVLNKRYFVRRGSQIDLDALIRNVPGGGVMVNDPEKDVKVTDTRDVTGSSYQEQDRLAVEFDELVGGFSPGSVQSNRALNETVGGMDRIASSAGAVQDYGVKIFFETWLEPTLQQIVRLEQFYENDETILAIAGRKSSLFVKAGQSIDVDRLLSQNLIVRVNVGLGNTDPIKRVERLIFGVSQAAALPDIAPRLKSTEITDEIFGALGFKDGSRFIMTDEELQQATEGKEPAIPPEIQVKMRELDIREQDNSDRDKREMAKLEMDREIKYAELALKEKLTLEEMYTRLGVEKAKIKTQRDTTALKEANRLSEMNIKRSMGSGI